MVGVPDGIGEQVACAVVADLEHDPALSRPEVQAKVEEHFRKVSADLPIWKRVRSLHFWDGGPAEDGEAVDQAARRRGRDARLRKKTRRARARWRWPSGDRGEVTWLLDTVATVSGERAATCSWAAASASWASTA